jgi:hypothetical protein
MDGLRARRAELAAELAGVDAAIRRLAGRTPAAALGALAATADRMPGGGIRLAEARRVLEGWSREEVDATLRGLQREGRLVLYPFDDPALIGPADEAARLMIAGCPRHYMFLR